MTDMVSAMTEIHYAERRAYSAGVQSERARIERMESENRELREHIRHLEDSLAVALGKKMGLDPETEQRERESEQAQVNLDHRRELSEDPPQRVPIVGPVKS